MASSTVAQFITLYSAVLRWIILRDEFWWPKKIDLLQVLVWKLSNCELLLCGMRVNELVLYITFQSNMDICLRIISMLFWSSLIRDLDLRQFLSDYNLFSTSLHFKYSMLVPIWLFCHHLFWFFCIWNGHLCERLDRLEAWHIKKDGHT